MDTLEGRRALVTGGSRGLGLGIVEALVARKAEVTVLARDRGRLADVGARLGVKTIAGDITDPALARSVLAELRPDVLVLNAGRPPQMGALQDLSWEDFGAVWNHDVKAGLFWIQAALRLPLPRHSRVLVSSSGAAIAGSPLSGGYAGAKRTLWLMAKYANGVSAELDLGVRFQVLVLRQMVGATEHGSVGSLAYAKKKGITQEAFLAGFGEPMSPSFYGEQVASLLTDARYETGLAYGIKTEYGIREIAEG